MEAASVKNPTSINWECTHRQLEGKAAAADLTPWISTHWPLHVGVPPKEVRLSLWSSQGKQLFVKTASSLKRHHYPRDSTPSLLASLSLNKCRTSKMPSDDTTARGSIKKGREVQKQKIIEN